MWCIVKADGVVRVQCVSLKSEVWGKEVKSEVCSKGVCSKRVMYVVTE